MEMQIVHYRWSAIYAVEGVTSWSHMSRYKHHEGLFPPEPRLSTYGVTTTIGQVDSIVMFPTWIRLA